MLLALQACTRGAKKKVVQVSVLASTPCYVKLMQVFCADKASPEKKGYTKDAGLGEQEEQKGEAEDL